MHARLEQEVCAIGNSSNVLSRCLPQDLSPCWPVCCLLAHVCVQPDDYGILLTTSYTALSSYTAVSFKQETIYSIQMYIYAIDRIGDAAYKCNEDATRDAPLTPLLPYISLSTPSKVCPLSVFTRTLTPTRFAYGRQKSICCNMKQATCCSQVALCIIASLHLHCCHEQRHTYQNRSITQVLGSSSSEICPLNLVDVAAACVAAAQQVTSMGRQHRYSINPSRLIAD